MLKKRKPFWVALIFFTFLVFVFIIYLKPVSKYKFFHEVKHNPEIQLQLNAYAWHITKFKRVFNHYPSKSEFIKFTPVIDTLIADLLANNVVINHNFTPSSVTFTLHNPRFKSIRFLKECLSNKSSFFQFLFTGSMIFIVSVDQFSDFCEPRTNIYFIANGRLVIAQDLKSRIAENITNLIEGFKYREQIVEGYYAYCCFDNADSLLTFICDHGSKHDKLDLLFHEISDMLNKTTYPVDISQIYFPIVLHPDN